MWEWDLSGSEGNIKEWNVKEDGDESGLEEKSEVSEVVDHTLLGEGKVSGLADHEISPLYAYDGYEISGLSEFKSFSGVANWMPSGNVGSGIELRIGIAVRVVSAASPGIWGSEDGIEESDINQTVLILIPTKLIVILEVLVVLSLDVAVSIEAPFLLSSSISS